MISPLNLLFKLPSKLLLIESPTSVISVSTSLMTSVTLLYVKIFKRSDSSKVLISSESPKTETL